MERTVLLARSCIQRLAGMNSTRFTWGRRVNSAPMNEFGCVVARRQANMDRVLCSGGSIVVFQPLAKRMRGYAHNRIRLRIKIMRPAQGLDGNTVFLDFVDRAFEVLFANKAQEPNEVVRSAKKSRRQD